MECDRASDDLWYSLTSKGDMALICIECKNKIDFQKGDK
jgi:hypothetical protein